MTLHIAYLTNAYPKVSHSFIRREILALEELGIAVTRLTIRASVDFLPDPADRAELVKTVPLLGVRGAARSMAASALATALRHPVRLIIALKMAMQMARASGGNLIRHLIYLAEACRVGSLMRERRIAHVHVHFGTNPAAVARLARAVFGISYSITVHGPDEFDAPQSLSLGPKIADAAFVVGVSDFGRSQLMRWAELAVWDRIKVVRCGLDDRFLQTSPPPPATASRLLCIARMSGQKGLPLLLEAVAKVAVTHPGLEVRIVGDGELRALLEGRIRTLGLGNCVKLLGWLSSEQIRDELSSCRALILPSFAEGLPVVLMEALAQHRPVIATAIAGIPELVDDSCGWLVPAGSVDLLVQAMIAALEAPPEQLAKMGSNGRERVAVLHDARANAALLAQEFLRSSKRDKT